MALLCSACNETKAESEFHRDRSRPRGYRYTCRPCTSEIGRAQYRSNLRANRERKRADGHNWPTSQMPWYIAARDKLDALKNHPCVDCGVKYMPAVMEFDHVRGEKKFMINMKTIKRPDLEEELAKCELRCANCHRTRHALVAAERQEARLAS